MSHFHAFFLVMGVFFALSIFLNFMSRGRNQKRQQEMEGVAQELGFTYTPWKGPSMAPLIRTQLFAERHTFGTCNNYMTGTYAGLDTQVFGYSYTSGPPGHSATVYQAVAVYTHDADFPDFTFGPASLVGKIIDMVEHQKVELNCSASFARHYVAHGKDQEKIRELFDTRLTSMIEGIQHSKNWTVEGTGKTLVVYRYGRIKPAELKDLLQETSSLAQVFFTRAASAAFGKR